MVNQKQWDAYKLAIYEPDMFIWRTRRGGKTIMMSVLEVFWTLIKFGEAYPGVVVHRCPTGDQLRMLYYWFSKNPFVTKIDKQQYQVHVLNSEPIWAAMTTANNSDGYGCSVLYEDEWGTEDADGLKSKQLESTRNFAIEGSFRGKRRLKASTVHYGSVGHEDIKKLQALEIKKNKKLIHMMTWDDCIKTDGTSWIPQEEKEKLIAEHLFDPSFIAEMFECKLVPKGGLFFDPDKWFVAGESKDPTKPPRFTLEFLDAYPVKLAGWDFNGDDAGHIEERGFWDYSNNMIIVKEEKAWGLTTDISNHIKTDYGVSHEIEGMPKRDGYNAGFAQHLMELNTPCIYQKWDASPKDYRLGIMQNSIIVLHPMCKWLKKNLQEAIFDKKSVLPKLLKTTDQHGMDSVCHLVHARDDGIDFTHNPSKAEYDQFTQYIKYRR